MSFKNIASVAFFGFIGGSFRYLLGVWFDFNGTIIVNIIGCFLLAFLTYFLLESQTPASWITLGLGTGLIGSFTTFSSFCLDTVKIAELHLHTYMIVYLIISIVGCYLSAFCGMKLGRLSGRSMKRGNRM
ncbi:fluoride efflux transporter FluC [Liquorilactobacillus mali]|uniref:fluoride efflux transporter FluC n=1 Tax=Liquorilactobacillus mali TaxID=1618 RepID=UPI002954448D|nr:CrcB family protein [Liquorilactobacillus mali]MDV7758322.1 chromosome condensation protein CrcB [Liquorilactobacillus mali]